MTAYPPPGMVEAFSRAGLPLPTREEYEADCRELDGILTACREAARAMDEYRAAGLTSADIVQMLLAKRLLTLPSGAGVAHLARIKPSETGNGE